MKALFYVPLLLCVSAPIFTLHSLGEEVRKTSTAAAKPNVVYLMADDIG